MRPWKQNCFIHIASMYESSGLQFFRTTTGIQSGPEALEEIKFVMITLTWELPKFYAVSD